MVVNPEVFMDSRSAAHGSALRAMVALCSLCAMLVAALPLRLAAQQPGARDLTGLVTEAGTGAPLGAVQVAVREVGASEAPRGGATDAAGRFTIRNVPPGRYQLRFIRLGFHPDTQLVTVPTGEGPVDVGTITMTSAPVQLGSVNVVASQSDVIHAADRDIYSADAVVGAVGGSATDVLQQIPDLEVDIDGNVRMLGQAPTIYINGRPAPMTGEALALFLEQFAAENIQSVEVMPNPSARYNAEGAGGIVNIVLKENVGLGVSGNAFVNGGTRGQLRGGGRATWQRGPLTLNGGGSLGLSSTERTSTQLRQNLLADPITFLGQAGRSDRSSWSGNLDLGARYELGESTDLDAELRVNRNVADSERVTRYTEMDAGRNVTDEYDMIFLDDGRGSSLDLGIELRHEFARRGDGDGARGARGGGDGPGRGGRGGRGRSPWERGNQLELEVEFERGGDLAQRFVERRILLELGEVDYADALTWEEDRQTESELSVGVDYAHGIGESSEIEVGYDGEFGWSDEGRLEEERAPGSPDDVIDRVRRGFVHRQTVHGGYLSLSRQFGNLGAQVGARAEQTLNRLELPGEGGVFDNDHLDVFPNANINYSFGQGKRIRLSYSVRVRRPSSNVLNPINTSSDPLSRRVGNPDIAPQYTHSYMLNASWSGDMGQLRATPFVRRSTNEWEQIRSVDEEGVATTTYDNLGSTTAYGMSVNARLREYRGIRASLNLNGQRTERDFAAVLGQAMPSSTRWSVRTNFDGEISSTLAAQGSLTYNPARDLPQGRASATLMTRVGLRYRFLDRRASLSFNVTDPFDVYDSSVQRSARGYVETGRDRVSMRRATIGLSYSFQSGGGGGRGEGGRRGDR